MNRPVARPGAHERDSAGGGAERPMNWIDRRRGTTPGGGTPVGLYELFEPENREARAARPAPPAPPDPPELSDPPEQDADPLAGGGYTAATYEGAAYREARGLPVGEPGYAAPIPDPAAYQDPPPAPAPEEPPPAYEEPATSFAPAEPAYEEPATSYAPAEPAAPSLEKSAAPPDATAAAPVDAADAIPPRTRLVHTVDKAPAAVFAIVTVIALVAVGIVGVVLRGASAKDSAPRATPVAARSPVTAKAPVTTPRRATTPTPVNTVPPQVRGIIVRAARGPVSVVAALPTGVPVFSQVLAQGTYHRFTQKVLVIQVGDAGAADIYVNGKRRPPLGLDHHVVHVTVRVP